MTGREICVLPVNNAVVLRFVTVIAECRFKRRGGCGRSVACADERVIAECVEIGRDDGWSGNGIHVGCFVGLVAVGDAVCGGYN